MTDVFLQARDRLIETIRRVRPYQVVLIALAAVLVLAVFGRVLFPIAVLGVVFALLFLWAREFLLLMQAPDDAFPGRFDKPIWALAILLLPPVGAPAFWVFRNASPYESPSHAKPRVRTWIQDQF